MIGEIIDGDYRVQELIGEGNFGVVYRCEELQLHRTVALKMLNSAKAGEKEIKRFLAEGRNLALLNHPNVVQIYRLGNHAGDPYIVMEHLTGKTLRDLLRRSSLQLRKGLEIMRQVASGMHAIHSMGIVHRDLSINNIMVTDSDAVKILDLGLSKDISNFSSINTGAYLVGTLLYVSPEQIDGKGATFRSEIFSFGVILYEILTGKNPFRAEHHMSVLYNIANREPEPIENYLLNCPPALVTLLSRCLEKRPDDRPADMHEVQQILTGILTITDLDTTVSTRIESFSGSSRSAPRNPYLNRVMIKKREDFFGRSQEIKRVFARLNANPPGSISVVGDRKIGKSSFLNYVYMRQSRQSLLEQPEKMVMIFLDLQEEKNMSMESFVRILIGIATFELRGRLDVSDCTLNLDGIKDLVQRLDGAGFRVAILLDEFDCITTNANFDVEFFSFLRFLANHYNVAYITSSARDLQALCHTKEISDSPFFNIFSTMRLSVFRPAEAEELIRVPSERVGKPLAGYTRQILDMSGLFPFFIQMACSHTLEYLDEHPGGEPDFGEVRRRFYEEARFHYRYIWDSFDAHERSAVIRVASGKSIPDALKHVLVELGSKHYVEPEDGKSKLFASTFQEFVQVEGSKVEKRSFLGRILGRKP